MRRFLWCSLLVLLAAPALATEYIGLALHDRVAYSDVIVIARVVDPAKGTIAVERTLKGSAPKQITLVTYVDGVAIKSDQMPLVANARELMFLKEQDGVYAPLQAEFGRLPVQGNELIDRLNAQRINLSRTTTSIQRLVTLQAQAERTDGEADAVFVTALKSSNRDLQLWALNALPGRITTPSLALVDAVLASWSKRVDLRAGGNQWDAASLVASAVEAWRLERVGPFFANILTVSKNNDERAWAALALGGTGNKAYLPLLRRVSTDDPDSTTRAFAYDGITAMLGPDSLPELRRGAQDRNWHVRSSVLSDVSILLRLEKPDPRWGRPSDALISEIRALLAELQNDEEASVGSFARRLLEEISQQGR